jgi:hypothetical protein
MVRDDLTAQIELGQRVPDLGHDELNQVLPDHSLVH